MIRRQQVMHALRYGEQLRGFNAEASWSAARGMREIYGRATPTAASDNPNRISLEGTPELDELEARMRESGIDADTSGEIVEVSRALAEQLANAGQDCKQQ